METAQKKYTNSCLFSPCKYKLSMIVDLMLLY